MASISLGILASSGAGGPLVATGGTIIDSNGYRHHIFDASGYFNIESNGKPKDLKIALVHGGSGPIINRTNSSKIISQGGTAVAKYYSATISPVKDKLIPITVGAGGYYQFNELNNQLTDISKVTEATTMGFGAGSLGSHTDFSYPANSDWLESEPTLLKHTISLGGIHQGDLLSGNPNIQNRTITAPQEGEAHSLVFSEWSQSLLGDRHISGGAGDSGGLRVQRYVQQSCPVYFSCFNPNTGMWGPSPVCGLWYTYDCSYWTYPTISKTPTVIPYGSAAGENVAAVANSGGAASPRSLQDATYMNNNWLSPTWNSQQPVGGSGYAIVSYALEG